MHSAVLKHVFLSLYANFRPKTDHEILPIWIETRCEDGDNFRITTTTPTRPCFPKIYIHQAALKSPRPTSGDAGTGSRDGLMNCMNEAEPWAVAATVGTVPYISGRQTFTFHRLWRGIFILYIDLGH